MATVVDYLGAGPEVLQSDIVSNRFPGSSDGDPKRSIIDFQAEEAGSVELNPREVQEDVFKKALNKEVDVNSFFQGPNKIDSTVIENALSANEALKLAASANQVLPNAQQLNEQVNLFKRRYDRSVPTSDKLYEGVQETGSFPINVATGQVIMPESITAGDQNTFMKNVFPNNKTVLEDKAKVEGKFMEWSSTQPEAPADPKILKAIARRFNPTLGGNLARRTYETVGFLKEGLAFYLPELVEGTAKMLLPDSIFDEPRDTFFSDKMEKELAQFRKDGAFGLSQLLPDTDRHRIINDLIRDDIRKTMTPEEFEQRGYNEKITVDGMEVFKKNFVTPKFASQVFEYAIDEMGFFEQVATFIAEGAVAFKALTAPVILGKRISDGINGTQRILHKRKYGSSNVPFVKDTINSQVARSKSYALTHGISVKDAAKEIALMNTNEGRLAKFSANRIANIVNKRFNYESVKDKIKTIQTQIDEKGRLLTQARLSNNPTYANKLADELSILKNNRNYQMYKVAGTNALLVGLNPRQDLTIGMVQASGRNLFASSDGTRDGSMGEGLAVAGYLLFGGVKKFYNYQSGIKIPLAEDFVQNKAFQAKIGIENIANVLLLGYGKGMLVNPDLRSLNNLKGKLNITTTGIRTIDEFTKNALGLPKVQSDMIIKNLMESVQDIHLMTKDIPDQFRKGIQDKLVLSLADSAGVSVFHGISQFLNLEQLGYKKRDILKFSKSVKKAMDVQDFGEERIKNFSALADGLKAQILELENSATVAPEVISRLKTVSRQYEDTAKNQQLIFNKSVQADIVEIDNFLTELANPQNGDILNAWTSRTGLDNGLAKLFELRNKAETYLTGQLASGNNVGVIYEAKDKLVNLAGNLVDAVIQSNKRLKLTSNQVSSIDNSNKSIKALVTIIKEVSNSKVQTAYSKIDPSQSIDFVNTGDNIITMFQDFATGYGSDISKMTNINTSPLLGNSAGRQLLSNLENGSKRGLMRVFNDSDILDIMNKQLNKDDTPFESGDDLYKYFKDEAQSNPAIRNQYGLSENDTMSNFQMLQYMVQNDQLAFNADDFGFLASPLEFEKLRQSFQVFAKNNNPTLSSLGVRMVALIDQDFKLWGSTVDAVTFNDVVRARNVARLEKQRFDKNTIGDQIDQVAGGSPIKFLGVDGKETTITKSNINKIFDPMISAIIKPSDTTRAFVDNEMQRFIATFASRSETLPENVLVKGADGKLQDPSNEQISAMVKPVFDLTKKDGQVGLAALSETLESLMYSKFVSTKGMFNVGEQIKNGQAPDVTKMTLGNVVTTDTTGINLPKQIPLPSQFKNYEEYIDSIEELITVTVRRVGKDGEIEEVSMPAFDVREMMRSEEHITNTIMSSKNFKQTHKEFVDLVKKENEIAQSATVKLFQAEQSEVYKKSRLYKENMTGESFFNDVIMRGDPNSVDIYVSDINRLVDAGEMTLEQGQKALQALVVDVLRASGQESKNGATFKFYNGQKMPISSYQTPEVPFALLTAFDDLADDGTKTALSFSSQKFNALMDAAGVTEEQKEVLIAMYRHSTKTDAQAVLARAGASGAKLVGPNPGFTLNNTLSKAFNIARGMVSKEYVMAEMAIRYAALADGAILNTILNDERVSNTILNLMNDPTRVLEADADYFVRAMIKFSATALKNVTQLNHDNMYKEEDYWRSGGVVYPKQKKQLN